MTIFATTVHCDEEMSWGGLADGRHLGVPLAWFPRLLDASPDDRAEVEVSPFGLQWAALDEDISVPALLSADGLGWRLEIFSSENALK